MKKGSLYYFIAASLIIILFLLIFISASLRIMHVILSNNIPDSYYKTIKPEAFEDPVGITNRAIRNILVTCGVAISLILFIILFLDTQSDKRHVPKQMVWMKWKPNYQIVPRGYFNKGVFSDAVSRSSFEKCGGNLDDLEKFLCHDFNPESLGLYDFALISCVVGYIGKRKSWYKLPLGDRTIIFIQSMKSLMQW